MTTPHQPGQPRPFMNNNSPRPPFLPQQNSNVRPSTPSKLNEEVKKKNLFYFIFLTLFS